MKFLSSPQFISSVHQTPFINCFYLDKTFTSSGNLNWWTHHSLFAIIVLPIQFGCLPLTVLFLLLASTSRMLIMFLSVDFKFIFIFIINQVSLTGLLLPLFVMHIDCAFYTLSSADHDFDLSIAFKYLPNAQKKHVQMHLLDFLGLDRVPNPVQKGNYQPFLWLSFHLRHLLSLFLFCFPSHTSPYSRSVLSSQTHPFSSRWTFSLFNWSSQSNRYRWRDFERIKSQSN